MNRKSLNALILALTLVIVLPAITGVNAVADSHNISQQSLLASGSPGPPPIPPGILEPVLVASGSPGPPPIPPTIQKPVLVASGSPGPPPIPPGLAQPVLVASGSPGPPPIPPTGPHAFSA